MQEPFPHVLSYSNGVIRVVTPIEISKGDTISELTLTGVNGQPFKIDHILLKREAKGDWTNWPSHPTYYEATAHPIL